MMNGYVTRANVFRKTLGRALSSLQSPIHPQLDLEYLTDPQNTDYLRTLIKSRKGVGDIDLVQKLWKEYSSAPTQAQTEKYDELVSEALKIPNRSHLGLETYGEEPQVVKYLNSKREFDFNPRDFADICQRCHILRTENLGLLAGHKSYILKGDLSELEHALVQYTVDQLLKRGFSFVSVPDMLPSTVIEGCGMATRGDRAQVYSMDPKKHGDLCLSGTAEMALGGYFMNKVLREKDLPMKVAAVSRCYRAEVSSTFDERGIYRVHQFTKVEMFGLTKDNISASNALLQDFVDLQTELFTSYGIYCQVLDMPLHELGAPAYRKFDIESWMPGRGMFGEISSSSNCTDYQSRRLNIKYNDGKSTKFCHTVNGTACAVPRMLIALLETHQNKYDTVSIPEVLRPYMSEKKLIDPPVVPLKAKWMKAI